MMSEFFYLQPALNRGCLTIVWSYVDIGLVLLDWNMSGGKESNWPLSPSPPPPPEQTAFEKPKKTSLRWPLLPMQRRNCLPSSGKTLPRSTWGTFSVQRRQGGNSDKPSLEQFQDQESVINVMKLDLITDLKGNVAEMFRDRYWTITIYEGYQQCRIKNTIW